MASVIPLAVTSLKYPCDWIQFDKESTEITKCSGDCRLPNGDHIGRVYVYKDVLCERVDKKRMNWDIDGDHKCISFQFKLDQNPSVTHDIDKFHWIQFIRREKTDSDGNQLQHCMQTSPATYQYRQEWYLNVPRTRDINKQTIFYEKYGSHNISDDELCIFVNPKGWFDDKQHNKLSIQLESYLVMELEDKRYCVLFQVHCEKQYDLNKPEGHFININSKAVHHMIDPMQSDEKWIVGYTTAYSNRKDDQHAILVDNPIITKIDALLMR